MTLLNNFLAAFPGPAVSPLYGKPLVYLIDATKPPRAIPGSVVAGPPGCRIPGTTDSIAYSNANRCSFDLNFGELAARGYRNIMFDDMGALSLGFVMSAITMAHGDRLAVVVKDPLLTNGPQQLVSHSNVSGVIVEGDGSPSEYANLLRAARKPNHLPVWFVFQGRDGADDCAAAITAGQYAGMGVTYSTGPGYTDCRTLLLPSA